MLSFCFRKKKNYKEQQNKISHKIQGSKNLKNNNFLTMLSFSFYLLLSMVVDTERVAKKIQIHSTTKTVQLYVVDYRIINLKQTEKQSQILPYRSS